ncbi:MAG: GspL/Epsl periplasmic domain-containing protein [Mariprofundaceae bacterium]
MIANWDGAALWLQGDETQIEVAPENGTSSLSELNAAVLEGYTISILLLPLEQLLLRPFSLPLAHPRLLNQDIINQEMAEQSGEVIDAWWVSWLAGRDDQGVKGLLVALPTSEKEKLENHASWSDCRFIGVDAWVRLNHYRSDDAVACAVVDVDDEGLFFGYFEQGEWQGIRRLQRNINAQDSSHDAVIVEDVVRSLTSMGYKAENSLLTGNVDQPLASLLLPELGAWHGEIVDQLESRQQATLHAASVGEGLGPNFRRGSWSFRGDWRKKVYVWRLSAILIAALFVISIASESMMLQRLQDREVELSQGIEAAFHRGLPNESVMIDPLAQLKAAAGPTGDASAWYLLQQLTGLGNVHALMADIGIQTVNYEKGKMHLHGDAADFEAVSRLAEKLNETLGQKVSIEDTELSGGKRVHFKLIW